MCFKLQPFTDNFEMRKKLYFFFFREYIRGILSDMIDFFKWESFFYLKLNLVRGMLNRTSSKRNTVFYLSSLCSRLTFCGVTPDKDNSAAIKMLYKLDPVNSNSFVGHFFLRIKWIFELNIPF